MSPGPKVRKQVWKPKSDGTGLQKPRRLDIVLADGGALNSDDCIEDMRRDQDEKEKKQQEKRARAQQGEARPEEKKQEEEEASYQAFFQRHLPKFCAYKRAYLHANLSVTSSKKGKGQQTNKKQVVEFPSFPSFYLIFS